MATLLIGGWVRRLGLGDGGGRWHVVESTIAGAAITRCGRRMEPAATAGSLEAREVIPDDSGACKRCVPGRRVATS